MKKPSLRSWTRLERFWDSLCGWCGAACQAIGLTGGSRRSGRPSRQQPFRPTVEGLEARQVLSTFGFEALSYSTGEAGLATITVERVGSTAGTATVDYASSNGTATAGPDYTAVSGTLSFEDGQSVAAFNVLTSPDALVEGDEGLSLQLSAPSAGNDIDPAEGSASLTIVDDDPGFRFAAASYFVKEGTPLATITVERIGSTAGSASVGYMAAGGTATPGGEYSLGAGPVLFADGQSSATFNVTLFDDGLTEADEYVTLALHSPSPGYGLHVSLDETVLTIADDETIDQLNEWAGLIEEWSDTIGGAWGDPISGVGHNPVGGVGPIATFAQGLGFMDASVVQMLNGIAAGPVGRPSFQAGVFDWGEVWFNALTPEGQALDFIETMAANITTAAFEVLGLSQGDYFRLKGLAEEMDWLGERLQAAVDHLSNDITGLEFVEAGLVSEPHPWPQWSDDQETIEGMRLNLLAVRQALVDRINSLTALLNQYSS